MATNWYLCDTCANKAIDYGAIGIACRADGIDLVEKRVTHDGADPLDACPHWEPRVAGPPSQNLNS